MKGSWTVERGNISNYATKAKTVRHSKVLCTQGVLLEYRVSYAFYLDRVALQDFSLRRSSHLKSIYMISMSCVFSHNKTKHGLAIEVMLSNSHRTERDGIYYRCFELEYFGGEL